ncbi:hypothetical protein FZI85_00455 [Mycobacterium sp. CBMA293]|uniref:hypothetical protein n=1 Tax=unclassified Mycolicibacterium TaxID=2636767 RepID=UPI0012DD1575|nr:MULTISPECIES: hypothetical protein [unclassified Mycolicibacterium]MUL45108.1 hypothetical protein [Mycolicibacterium sp. CBMA 360]MUL57777.1 hypothetical protein [Mycolicibacterium sp. CBMA 335]MUL72774.1 hypothetical protein [Mycolicibacterium sp. CBMA 311]MUL96724.1 hypothetical protein [Mycolicibacterium sp. CBMA 230]MUM07209.1 hypothetical protein [Mycolicibacterium sp. CBMA 213]
MGGVLGGIGWGLLAVGAIGGPGDEIHLGGAVATYLLVAAGISVICLMIAGLLYRTRALRTAAVALAVAPVGGWIVVGLLYLQGLAMALASH